MVFGGASYSIYINTSVCNDNNNHNHHHHIYMCVHLFFALINAMPHIRLSSIATSFYSCFFLFLFISFYFVHFHWWLMVVVFGRVYKSMLSFCIIIINVWAILLLFRRCATKMACVRLFRWPPNDNDPSLSLCMHFNFATADMFHIYIHIYIRWCLLLLSFIL